MPDLIDPKIRSEGSALFEGRASASSVENEDHGEKEAEFRRKTTAAPTCAETKAATASRPVRGPSACQIEARTI